MSIDRYTPYRDVGPVTLATWNNTVSQYGGRAALGTEKAWKAAGNLSGVLLRILIQESSVDTDYKWNSKANNNPYNIRVKDRSNEGNPKGYIAYPDLVTATKAAADRINGADGFFDGPNPYATAVTIRDLLYTYAPPQWNDTEGLITKMERQLNAWLPNWSPPVQTPSTDPEPIPGEGEPMALEILNRVIGVQGNAPATKLNMGPGKTRPIIHNTDNPSKGADALMHAKFVASGGGSGNVSFHFANDSNRAVQILPLDRIGYHASDGCDNRNTDTGCFDGIAIENCDNIDGNIDQTFENLAELLACIEFGDPRIDYGTKPKSDFVGFIDRTLGHHDVAYDQKWCPSDFMNKYGETGYKTKLKARAKQLLAIKQGGTTPAPEPVYAPAHPVSKESQIINEHVFLAPGGKTFQRDTIPAEWGDGLDNPTGPIIKKGTKITQDQISHVVQGTTGNLYLVLTGVSGVADGSRVPADAVIAA